MTHSTQAHAGATEVHASTAEVHSAATEVHTANSSTEMCTATAEVGAATAEVGATAAEVGATAAEVGATAAEMSATSTAPRRLRRQGNSEGHDRGQHDCANRGSAACHEYLPPQSPMVISAAGQQSPSGKFLFPALPSQVRE
jgi:hypothetical protein